MNRKVVVAVVAVLLIVAIFVVVRLVRGPEALVYSGTVETREIQVGSKVGGRITEVAVEEGQAVKASAPLVRFEADELKAQRAQAQAAVEQAQAALSKMEHGYRTEEIAQVVVGRDCLPIRVRLAKRLAEHAQQCPHLRNIAGSERLVRVTHLA